MLYASQRVLSPQLRSNAVLVVAPVTGTPTSRVVTSRAARGGDDAPGECSPLCLFRLRSAQSCRAAVNVSVARQSRRARSVRALAGDDEPEEDFITSIVAKLFGQAAVDDPAPAGLTRMTKEEWPDQWVAVEEMADPLDGEDGEPALLRPLLKQTQLCFLPLTLVFDADIHGWSNTAFHECVCKNSLSFLAAFGVVLGGTRDEAGVKQSANFVARSSLTLCCCTRFAGASTDKVPRC